MLDYYLIVFVTKFIVSCGIVLYAERRQLRPYYYLREVILASILIAFLPLLGHLIMYAVAGYQLRLYPYGVIRAWLWPVELYRALVMRLTRRYPFRR